ncbi:hypothetical protein ACS0TY_012589 [Phlomoides rotata]
MFTSFFIVDDLKIWIEKRLAKNLNPDDGSRQVLELVSKHLDYYEHIAKRSISRDIDRAMYRELNEIKEMVESLDFEHSNDVGENVKQKVESFTRLLKTMEQRYGEGLYNSFCDVEEEEEDDGDAAATSKVIGVSEVYQKLKQNVFCNEVTSLVGMPGIGKTTLANKIFHDPAIVEYFDHRVWIRVGRKCGVKDIPRRILAEIDPDSLQTLPAEEAIHEYLKTSLKSKKYLIVLDDVWDKYMAHFLDPYHRFFRHDLEHPFLHRGSGSRILLTSRMRQEKHIGRFNVTMMPLLTEKESWNLFCEKVFCGRPCPHRLEKAGKKISKNCEGLPLTILAVARLLSQDQEKSTPEYWDEVAENEHHLLFKEAFEEISKVLLPSYTFLPRILQICFHFIGLFRQKYKIPRSKLINLWLADGFDELKMNPHLDSYANDYLMELVDNNLVLVYQEGISHCELIVKSCGLHSSLWHLSNKKARETKFALVLRTRDDALGDVIKGQRRLSFHNHVLFSIKDVYQSVEDNCASTIRSILCFGPYHQYQVPICFGLKLLTELDALLIRFYDFPLEVVQLVRLRYLTLTLNGVIPSSISQLSNLQFFIVDQHQSIKSHKGPSYLPGEIWGMKELKHLQATGSDLPDPCGASLESLSTLLNLDILKCIIINPVGVRPIVPLTNFLPLSYLKKLTLSGLGYPWKEMSKISSLPCLEGLKLKNNAFQGPEWNVEEKEFKDLRFLVIEDSDLVRLKVGDGAFQWLRLLYIRHCYKLEKIQLNLKCIFFQRIELVDCKPSFVEKFKMDILKDDHFDPVFDVHSSWDDTKLRT